MISKKHFIFLGAPGVGKGTLAQILAQKEGVKHISTGEIFRAEIKSGSDLGKEVESILASGGYVSDDITNEIVKRALTDEVKAMGYILDGYPRTIAQAQFLKSINAQLDAVILFEADEETVVTRLLGRGRADDNEATIKDRLHIYNEKTAPLIDYYIDEEILFAVDASDDVETNYARLIEVIK